MSGPAGSIAVGATTYVFHVWEGQVEPIQLIPDIYARLGQTGQGSQLLGYRAPASRIRGTFLTSSLTTAISQRTSVAQLAGSYGNITEPTGASWTGALIASVRGRVRGGIHNLSGVQYSYRVEFDLTIFIQA